MLVNIDICGDILVQAETDFERDYVRQFGGCTYSAFVKCGLTPAEVVGLKLRKTSNAIELAATTANIQRDVILLFKECEANLPICPKWQYQYQPKDCQCIRCRVKRFVEQNDTRL